MNARGVSLVARSVWFRGGLWTKVLAAAFFFLCCGLVGGGRGGIALAAFGFQNVVEKAARLAQSGYEEPPRSPEFLLRMNYDAFRDIRFDPEQALWKKEKLPFTIQFFHPGFNYVHPVKIHAVEGQKVTDVAFSSEFFSYGGNDFKERIPPDLGYAGFRIHYPVKTAEYLDEIVVFLGASYFRAVGRNHQYGISARGLAIDTASSAGEEFPAFTEFWIVKPWPAASQIRVYALLDSPRITGAYAFEIKPGEEMAVKVRSRLFLRKRIDRIGIAPLTSMFFYGENTVSVPDDFRPEVHDSDGLLVAFRSGEWLWRPLVNPQDLKVYSFDTPDPIGFGLLQRDQNFDHYQDLEARYDIRPSVWISPLGKWGPGRVELVEIPSPNELNDNITAFWVPENVPGPGKPLAFDYTMSWHSPDGTRPPGGRVVDTRTAVGHLPNSRKFVIDFAGRDLEAMPADKPITAVVSTDERSPLLEHQLFKNRVTGGWRLVFQIQVPEPGSLSALLPDRKRPLELRAFLKDSGNNVLTETWSYAFEL